MIAGADSAATEGGGNFLTSEDRLSRFQKMLNISTLPCSEVVLKTSSLNGTPIEALAIPLPNKRK
jgi:hypothetical protein